MPIAMPLPMPIVFRASSPTSSCSTMAQAQPSGQQRCRSGRYALGGWALLPLMDGLICKTRVLITTAFRGDTSTPLFLAVVMSFGILFCELRVVAIFWQILVCVTCLFRCLCLSNPVRMKCCWVYGTLIIAAVKQSRNFPLSRRCKRLLSMRNRSGFFIWRQQN